MPRIKLRDLANAAGVSTAAVSFALNGKPGVSQKTREHVLKVAEQIGYQPDAAMSQLMAHVGTRNKTASQAVLAFVTDHSGGPRAWERNPSVRAPWEGAKARAEELGYRLEEFWYADPEVNPRRLRSILRARGIQGLIFSMAPRGVRRLDFDFSGFASAMTGVSFHEPEITVVVPDHYINMLLVLKHAYAKGYRRPLLSLVNGPANRMEDRGESAYHSFCLAHPDVTALPAFISSDYDGNNLCDYVDEVKPDVVISNFGNWIRDMGKRVPEKFGWVSLNWSEEDADLAGMDRRLYEQGGFVVDAVVAALHRNEPGVPALRKEIMLKGVFVEGPSLPDRKPIKNGR